MRITPPLPYPIGLHCSQYPSSASTIDQPIYRPGKSLSSTMATPKPAGAQDPASMEVTIEEMLATRLSLSSVSVKGATRTSETLIGRLTQPVISTGGTFASVVEDVSKAVDYLRSTNCYKGVDAFLDTSSATLGEASSSAVLFTLAEKSRFQVHTGTSIDTSPGGRRDPSVEASFVWRNLSGQADTLRAAASWMGGAAGDAISIRPTNRLSVDYRRPFAFDLRAGLSAILSNSIHNHEQHSSHTLSSSSATVALDHPFGRLALITDWRHMLHVEEKASPLVHADAGHSWKTSLKHVLEVDRRDDRRMPKSGDYTCITLEGTLPIGDIRYTKVDVAHQLHIPFGTSGITASFSSRFGALFSKERTSLIDRFYLGGPTSLRGFEYRGVGPRDADDAVGGDVYYAFSTMLSVPVPDHSLLSQMFNSTFHVFANVGELTDVPSARETLSTITKDVSSVKNRLSALQTAVVDPMRISAGLGLALETAVGRIELNYCRVLRSATTDVASEGFQFGISESFA